jgi:hypothetical protein
MIVSGGEFNSEAQLAACLSALLAGVEALTSKL